MTYVETPESGECGIECVEATMPVCCRCNGSGRCKSCSCVKSGRACVDYLPSRNGHCSNPGIHTPAADLDPDPSTQSSVTLPSLDTPRSDETNISSTAHVPTQMDMVLDASTTPTIAEIYPRTTIDDITSVETSTAAMESELPTRVLPSFEPVSCLSCAWGELSGLEISIDIDSAYSEIVQWRPNLFKVPSGASGKCFVGELARLFEAFATESAFEAFALKAVMTLPALVLQKPHAKSKTRDHISCLQRRFALWEKGDIAELLKEGKAIQRSLKASSSRRDAKDDATTARKFAQLMMEDRVRAALQFLTSETRSCLLSLEEVIGDGSGRTVREVLEDKHPDPEPVHAGTILNERMTSVDFHPVLFDNITAKVIRNSALHTEGAAGPSGVNALSWRRLCTAFGQKSNYLCSALAAVARRICTTYVDPSCLMAYTSCCTSVCVCERE